jgi:hypothetical protein
MLLKLREDRNAVTAEQGALSGQGAGSCGDEGDPAHASWIRRDEQ